jgi:hypothetical protein
MSEELQEIVAARQRYFRNSHLNGDDAKAGGSSKTLRVDGLGKAWRIGGILHEGMRTGNDSMPRTKLE